MARGKMPVGCPTRRPFILPSQPSSCPARKATPFRPKSWRQPCIPPIPIKPFRRPNSIPGKASLVLRHRCPIPSTHRRRRQWPILRRHIPTSPRPTLQAGSQHLQPRPILPTLIQPLPTLRTFTRPSLHSHSRWRPSNISKKRQTTTLLKRSGPRCGSFGKPCATLRKAALAVDSPNRSHPVSSLRHGTALWRDYASFFS